MPTGSSWATRRARTTGSSSPCSTRSSTTLSRPTPPRSRTSCRTPLVQPSNALIQGAHLLQHAQRLPPGRADARQDVPGSTADEPSLGEARKGGQPAARQGPPRARRRRCRVPPRRPRLPRPQVRRGRLYQWIYLHRWWAVSCFQARTVLKRAPAQPRPRLWRSESTSRRGWSVHCFGFSAHDLVPTARS